MFRLVTPRVPFMLAHWGYVFPMCTFAIACQRYASVMRGLSGFACEERLIYFTISQEPRMVSRCFWSPFQSPSLRCCGYGLPSVRYISRAPVVCLLAKPRSCLKRPQIRFIRGKSHQMWCLEPHAKKAVANLLESRQENKVVEFNCCHLAVLAVLTHLFCFGYEVFKRQCLDDSTLAFNSLPFF